MNGSNNQVWVNGRRCDPEFIDQQIKSAINTERERCARIADGMGSITNFASPAFDEACRKIAAKIRSGE